MPRSVFAVRRRCGNAPRPPISMLSSLPRSLVPKVIRMTSPTPQQLAHSGSLEELYKQLEPIRMGAGWAKPTPSLWAEPKKSFEPFVWSYAQAKGALDAAGRLINTELAERRNLIMQNPGGRQLRHLAHHRRGVPDDHAGRESALASPHAERAAADHRRRARRLHHRQRRAAFDDAGRRRADAELVLARPRQRQPRQRLLARRAGRAAGASARADVLRAASGRVRAGEGGGDEFADAFLLGRDGTAAGRGRRGSNGQPAEIALGGPGWKTPRSPPWRWR